MLFDTIVDAHCLLDKYNSTIQWLIGFWAQLQQHSSTCRSTDKGGATDKKGEGVFYSAFHRESGHCAYQVSNNISKKPIRPKHRYKYCMIFRCVHDVHKSVVFHKFLLVVVRAYIKHKLPIRHEFPLSCIASSRTGHTRQILYYQACIKSDVYLAI